MDRVSLAGLTLVVASSMGLLASELVATAHAARADGKAYLLAVSTSDRLRLVGGDDGAIVNRTEPGGAATIGSMGQRLMRCRGVMDLAAVTVGYSCREA